VDRRAKPTCVCVGARPSEPGWRCDRNLEIHVRGAERRDAASGGHGLLHGLLNQLQMAAKTPIYRTVDASRG
jgi:hypothetical protein